MSREWNGGGGGVGVGGEDASHVSSIHLPKDEITLFMKRTVV